MPSGPSIALFRLSKLPQPLEPNQLILKSRIARIQPARIRQHKHPRAEDLLLLRTRTLALRDAEKSAVDTHSDERDQPCSTPPPTASPANRDSSAPNRIRLDAHRLRT